MKTGIGELLLVLIVALVVVGPEKLPYYARQLGKTWAEVRKTFGDAAGEFSKGIHDPAEEVASAAARQKESSSAAEKTSNMR